MNLYLLLSHADPEVTLIELIWNVPAEGPKLPPLLHQSMEETEPKEQLSPDPGFVAPLEECWVRNWVVEVRAEQIGSQTLRRLIGHFHSCTVNRGIVRCALCVRVYHSGVWRQGNPLKGRR